MTDAIDTNAYESLGSNKKAQTLINDRILDEIAQDPSAYNQAIREAKKAGTSPEDAFQAVLDARRDALAMEWKNGAGGFKPYEQTALSSNKIEDVQDYENGKTILRQVRDQLVDANPQFGAEDIGRVIKSKRNDMDFYTSVAQIMPAGVCVAPLDASGNISLPAVKSAPGCGHEH